MNPIPIDTNADKAVKKAIRELEELEYRVLNKDVDSFVIIELSKDKTVDSTTITLLRPVVSLHEILGMIYLAIEVIKRRFING